MDLTNKNVLLGISGGIAVYKVCSLVRLLKKHGANVDVIMTEHSQEFVSKLTFETLSGNPVTTDMFNRTKEWEVEHISLAQKADVFVVAPATANLIGKYANGIADDMLSTTLMATKAPILFAPAMNEGMYESDSFCENLAKIQKRQNVNVINANTGFLACGTQGKGRMAEPEQIYEKIEQLLFPKQDLKGKTILITAGGTQAQIDAVRYLVNRSSGKQGVELAVEAQNRGANVILVLGTHSCKEPKHGVEIINVSTTAEMASAVDANFDRADAFIMSAAPCDYVLKNANQSKKLSDSTLTLELEKTVDIAKTVGERKGNKKLVIFSAEVENCLERATEKLNKKHADFCVMNDVSQPNVGFGFDTNAVTIIDKTSKQQHSLMTKKEVANIILDKITTLP